MQLTSTAQSLIGKFQSPSHFFDCSFAILFTSLIESQYLRQVAIALSPDLAENEMRIVLSWETSQDLDIYALQMEK